MDCRYSSNRKPIWFDAVSGHPGSEVLAVQTLRNALMSATMTASTAVLGLMGTATLVAPILAPILHPLAGPPAAIVVAVALNGSDRVCAR